MIVFVFVLLFVYLGYKSGLIRTLFGIMSYFISILISFMLYPVVSDIFKSSTLYEIVFNYFQKKVSSGNQSESILFSGLINSVNSSLSETITNLTFNVISFVIVLLISKIVLSILSSVFGIISRLPVISFFNRIGGAILGGIKGIVVLYIAFSVIMVIPQKENGNFTKDLKESKIASQFYQKNIIFDIIGKDVLIKNDR